MLKTIGKRLLSKLGYDIVAHGTGSRLILSDALRKLFTDYDVDLIFDIGANRGQYYDYLRNEIGYKGRIISLEPNPKDYTLCADRSRDDSRWDVHNLALGSIQGKMHLNVMEDSVFSSFLNPKQDRDDFPGNVIEKTIPVDVITFDSFVEKFGLDLRHAYLKCDTQGFDMEVFRGATSSLSKLCGLQTEVSLLPIYEKQPSFIHTIDALIARNFRISALSPVSYIDGAVVEFDCVMINVSAQEEAAVSVTR